MRPKGPRPIRREPPSLKETRSAPSRTVLLPIQIGRRFGGEVALKIASADIAHKILNRDPSPQTQAAIVDGLQGKEEVLNIATLVISSPDFQRR